MSRERVYFQNPRGERIAGYLDSPPDGDGASRRTDPPGVLVCHGMLSNKDSAKHRRFAEDLAARGFLVLRFDFSYVGESGGKLEEMTFTGEVEDLESAAAFLRTRTKGPLGLIGSSMGSAVAALFAARDPGVSALVLMASLARPGNYNPEELDRYEAQGYIDTPLGNIGLGLLEDARRQDVLGAIGKVRAPVLLIHGEKDELIPVEEAMDLFHAAGGPRSIHIIGGADHRFSREADVEECAALIVDWFCRHLAPGAERPGARPRAAPARLEEADP
ncbi:MAG: alpha/beta hydrolase [Nitrospinota bacterium]